MAKKSKKERQALTPAGTPQGKHLAGFKGTKSEEVCFCGSCNPKAKVNAGRVLVMVDGKMRRA